MAVRLNIQLGWEGSNPAAKHKFVRTVTLDWKQNFLYVICHPYWTRGLRIIWSAGRTVFNNKYYTLVLDVLDDFTVATDPVECEEDPGDLTDEEGGDDGEENAGEGEFGGGAGGARHVAGRAALPGLPHPHKHPHVEEDQAHQRQYDCEQ